MFIEIDIEEIRNRVLSGEPIEDVLSRYRWQDFESAVAQIFATNGFTVFKNLRFKTDRRWEIDVVASNNGSVLCVDCKGWGNGRYKKTALRKAAEDQISRTESLERFISNNPIARHNLDVHSDTIFYPTIVTLFEEDVDPDNGVLVVPVWKLNSFLNFCF
jgi:Holliday junction resolvase-like predicted endonuclease